MFQEIMTIIMRNVLKIEIQNSRLKKTINSITYEKTHSINFQSSKTE